MSNATTVAAGTAHAARPAYKVTTARVVRAEWAKFWSLRSSWITLGVALVFILAFGLIRDWRYTVMMNAGHVHDPEVLGANAVGLSLFGLNFGQLAVGVLGVLVTAGEYSTGMIRSTLAAVPRRLPVLWSKALIFGTVALLLGVVAAVAAFGIGTGILSGTRAALGFGDAGVVRALIMALGRGRDRRAAGDAAAGPRADGTAADELAEQRQPVPAGPRGRFDVRAAPGRAHALTDGRAAGARRLDRPRAGRCRLPAQAQRRLSRQARGTGRGPDARGTAGPQGPPSG
jgi:hypothetical protein